MWGVYSLLWDTVYTQSLLFSFYYDLQILSLQTGIQFFPIPKTLGKKDI